MRISGHAFQVSMYSVHMMLIVDNESPSVREVVEVMGSTESYLIGLALYPKPWNGAKPTTVLSGTQATGWHRLGVTYCTPQIE